MFIVESIKCWSGDAKKININFKPNVLQSTQIQLHFEKSIIWLFCDLRFKRVSIADIGDKIYDDEKNTNQSLKQKI
jgi:hypothetical protein